MTTWLYDDASAKKRLKIAAVTMRCDQEPSHNLSQMIHIIETIKLAHSDVQLILFGEMILGYYAPGSMPAYHREIAEPLHGETTIKLGDIAIKHNVYISFGMSENAEGKLHNTQVLLNPQGDVQTYQRKWNLKPGEIQAQYQPGNSPVTVTDICGAKTGMIICSDAAHPRTMRELMRNRLELILFSLADDEDEDWFVAKANARLYGSWVVSANRYGEEQHFWNGHTIISDPLGVLRATSIDKAGYLFYDLGFDEDGSWLKRTARNFWVKAPLLVHVLTHLRILKSYFT